MKKLIAAMVIASTMFAANAQANDKDDLEKVTSAILHQQGMQVAKQVNALVNQDIQHALYAYKVPTLKVDETMLAKVATAKKKSEASE